MEQSSSSERYSLSGFQEIRRLLWNPKFHYRVHKRPRVDSILSQMHPFHILTPYLGSILILFSRLF